jgi:hypothetical protein
MFIDLKTRNLYTKILFLMSLNKYILVLLIATLTFPVYGQQGSRSDEHAAASASTETAAFPDLIPKPSHEASNGRFHFKVWIMSVIKGMKDSEVRNVENDNDDVQTGTHHLMIEVSDSEGNSVTDAMVKVSAISPTGREEIVDLDPMMAQYGANISFDEEGSYHLTVSVDAEGNPILTPFTYTVDDSGKSVK